jgi:hypothetical protein
MQRFRLVDVDGNDLGPFVANGRWNPGDRIHRGSQGDLVVLRMVEADASDNVDGYLVPVRVVAGRSAPVDVVDVGCLEAAVGLLTDHV